MTTADEMGREKPSTLPSDNTGPISHDEACEILSRYNDGHFKQGEGPRYAIPANVMRDDDIRLAAYIKQSRNRDNTQHDRLERARELLAQARPLVYEDDHLFIDIDVFLSELEATDGSQ